MDNSRRDSIETISRAAGVAPDAACRRRYVYLARKARRLGLNHSHIQESRDILTDYHGRSPTLLPQAFAPTGVALGCPMPDKAVSRRLWELARLVAIQTYRACGCREPGFSYVPPKWYHITLVNRTHFDKDNKIRELSEDEKIVLESVFHELRTGPLDVLLSGLRLTPEGRLIAIGIPMSQNTYALRNSMIAAIPELAVNLPVTYHVKLGHLITDLSNSQLATVLDYVARCGELLCAQAVFEDCYTPRGRIRF